MIPQNARYAVIFSSIPGDTDDDYYATDARLEELAQTVPGFVGIENARGEDGFGITVSYWESLEAIDRWRREAAHVEAKKKGRAKWYKDYQIHITRIEQSRALSGEWGKPKG